MPIPVSENYGATGSPLTKQAYETTGFGKILNFLGTGERLGTKLVYLPLVKQFMPDVYASLKSQGLASDQGAGNTYAGDIVGAIAPNLNPVTKFMAGMGAGALVDPISYVGLGDLTAAGHALNPIGTAARYGGEELAPTLAKQAEAGQRALLSFKVPWFGGKMASEGIPLVKGTPAFQALDLLKSGKINQRIASKVGLGETFVGQLAKGFDSFQKGIAQRLNFNVGVDGWLWNRMHGLFAEITGQNQSWAKEAFGTMDPALQTFAGEINASAKLYGRPDLEDPVKVYESLKNAYRQFAETSPNIETARDVLPTGLPSKRFTRRASPISEMEMAREAFHNNFPTPPSFGGPASPFEDMVTRQIRELHVLQNRMQIVKHAQEEDALGKTFRLRSDHYYLARTATSELKTALMDKAVDLGKANYMSLGDQSLPTGRLLNMVQRKMRIVNYKELDPLFQDGTLPSVVKLRRMDFKTKRMETVAFNLQKTLQKADMSLPTWKSMKALDHLAYKGMKIGGKVYKIDPEVLGRAMPDMSIDQAEAYIRDFGVPGLIEPGQIKQAFVHDPVALMTTRGMAANRAILSTQFWDEVKGRADLAVENKPGGTLPQDFVPVHGIPDIEGFAMHKDAADWVQRMHNHDLQITESLNPFIRGLTKATGWYKAWVLGIFPAYHTRNFLSNAWQGFMGSDSPEEWVKGMEDSGKFFNNLWHKNSGALVDVGGGKSMTVGEIYHNLIERNALGVGFISPDINDLQNHWKDFRQFPWYDLELSVKEGFKGNQYAKAWQSAVPTFQAAKEMRYLATLDPHSWFVRLGFKAGAQADDFLRVGHVIQKLRSGMTMDGAVMSMKKFFYDYHDLSQFERDTLRQIIPFYTWSRKNIPFYLESLIKSPGKMARFGSGLQGITSGPINPDEALVSDWFKKNMPARIRSITDPKTGQKTYEYFMFKNWLPVADIQDVFHMWDFLKTGLNPFFRIPIEELANYNFMTGRQIDRLNGTLWGGGEKTPYFTGKRFGIDTGIRLPNRLAHLFNSFRLTKTLNDVIDNPQDLQASTQIANLLTGKLYAMDPKIGRYSIQKDLQDIEDGMRRSVRSLVQRGASPDEIQRVLKIGQQKMGKASLQAKQKELQ